MSKKVVRNRDSYIKNWTTAITGSFVLVSTQSAQAHEHRGGFREFRDNNPGLEKRDLRAAFRQQISPGGLNVTSVSGSTGAVNNGVTPSARHSHHQVRIESRVNGRDAVSNVTIQSNLDGQQQNIRQGVDLDLSSQVANITLGEKLFGNTTSIEIQVGGETKTLTAGSQVTAAEYVAAKQVLAGLGQRVTIGTGGGATGGEVDLSAITGRGDVLRASDLTVPVNVTTIGDFAKGSEFRLIGDLNNSGTVYATNTDATNRHGGTVRADDILNNAGGVISSDVDLNLQADGSLTNLGSISSQGDLTITSSNVTNRGTISSAKDINLNAPTAATLADSVGTNTAIGSINVDSTGGTINATNNININANADSNLTGGDYLSQNLNLNAGAGTITAAVGNVTGVVNSTGYAVHFGSAAETLNLGAINLVDPTYYNIGNINFANSVFVTGGALTVIASGNITESVVGSFNISTQDTPNGSDITLIAGANITAASQPGDGTVGNGNPSDVTFNQGSISGGSILLGNAQIVSQGLAGNGGNVLLAAFGGTSPTSGVVNLANGVTTVGSNITTSGSGSGINGDVTVIAPNGIDLNSGGVGSDINASGGTGGGGNIRIITAQPVSFGPVTYLANGSLGSGQLEPGTTITDAAVDIDFINASGGVTVVSGGNMNIASGVFSTASAAGVSLFAGIDPVTSQPINTAATMQLGTIVSPFNILIETADNLTSSGQIDAGRDLVIAVGLNNPTAPAGADFVQNGFLSSTVGSIYVSVGDTYTLGNDASDKVDAGRDVVIATGVQPGGTNGDLIAVAPITAGGSSVDGSIFITASGNFTANNAAAKLTAGQGASFYVGSVNISAKAVTTVAGANILGDDVSLTSSSDNGGDFSLAGSVTANKNLGTAGVLSLTQNGTQTVDISDNDITGGISAQQINLTNNTANGPISILNTGTAVNFKDVTANAMGNITLAEPSGGGRDGNINFVGDSNSGGTFKVIVDKNITASAGSILSGVAGNFTSQGVGGVGNIGDTTNRLNVDFGDLQVHALGTASAVAGNAYLSSPGNLQFGGGDSQVTGVLDAIAVGNITTGGVSIVYAPTAIITSTGGNIGDSSDSFSVDAGTGVGQGVAANAFGDVFILDPNDSKVDAGMTSSAGLTFSFRAAGDLNVIRNVSATDIFLHGDNNLDFGPNLDITATNLVDLTAGNNITSPATAKVHGVELSVDVGGAALVNTAVDLVASNGGSGSLTVNEDDGIDIGGQSVTDLVINASKVSGGDVSTQATFFVGTLNVTNPGGDILINHVATGNSITLDTSRGTGSIGGTAGLFAKNAQLSTNTGDINLTVNGINFFASTVVTAQSSGGGDVTIRYNGSGTLTLGASSGNGDFTASTKDAAAGITIGGDISGSGALDLTTNYLAFGDAFTASFNSVTVQSLAGSDLTLDGGGIGIGGSFTTNAAGPGVTMTATDGSFIGLNKTNFNGGDLFVELANNNGVNAFDVTAGILNGDNTNDVSIRAALVIAPSLTNLTNWKNVILLGNTIQNSVGDVVLPNNLIFHGQNLAIIASGNVSAGTATIIDLTSATGDGGDLTVLAGFSNAPPTAGQVTTQNPVMITGFSATGGNIDLGTVNIDTSSTAAGGNAGSVTLLAAGGTGGSFLSAGTVTAGSITATAGNGGTGGTVTVAGSFDVTLGDIKTGGTVAGGDVVVGVGTVSIFLTPTYTNGVLSGGAFFPNALSSANIALKNIDAGTGDIFLAGALANGNTMSSAFGTTIKGDNLEIFMGAGFASLNTDVTEVQGNATAAPGGILLINEANSINVDHFDGSLNLTVAAVNNINIIGAVNVNTVLLQADTITTLPIGKIIAASLGLDPVTSAVVNTNVDGLAIQNTAATTTVTVNEDDGLALFAVSPLSSLTINASQGSSGNIATDQADDFTVGTLTINNAGGDIFINNQLTGTTSVNLDSSSGTGGIAGSGTVISPVISLFSGANDITLKVNGLADAGTDVTAEAGSGGNVSLTYLGSGAISLESSTGNTSYTVATTALKNGAVFVAGDIDGTGTMDITTATLAFSGAANVTLDFSNINVQSFAGGSGLTVDGGLNQGTFTTSGSGTKFTATDGDLVTTANQLNFNGGDVFMALGDNDGVNAFKNLGVLNGDGAFSGDPSANSITITAAVVTLGTIQNFKNVNVLQGNTIVNNAGDVLLPANLTFHGQSLAIIASGNVKATGMTLLDLSSTTGNGGTLTVLAGFDSSGTTAGQQQTILPVTITGFSTTGGNIDLTGVTIDTSSTAGNGGAVHMLAASSTGFTNAGTVKTGNIKTDGSVNGGDVAIAAFSGINVGNISTVGGTGTGGKAVLGIATTKINGTPTYTNGAQSGGSFTATGLAAGSTTFGTINTGSGDISLGGALAGVDSISGGAITGDDLQLGVGAGTVTLGTTVNTVAIDASSAPGGAVTINQTGSIGINAVVATNLSLAINTPGDIDFVGAANLGTGALAFTAQNAFESTGSIAAASLGFLATGNVTLSNLAISNLFDSSADNVSITNTGNLTINSIASTGAISVLNTGNLTVNTNAIINAVDSIFLQTLGSTPGNIAILGDSTIATAGAVKTGAGEGNVTILQGAAPTRTRTLRGKNIEVTETNGFVLTGRGRGTKKITANGPAVNKFTGTGATLLIKAETRGGVVIGGTTGNVIITADPPVPVGTPTITWTAPSANAKTTADLTPAIAGTTASLPAINSTTSLTPEIAGTTALSAALTGTTASLLSPINTFATMSSASSITSAANLQAPANRFANQEDDSYMTFSPMGQMVDGYVCSDIDLALTTGGANFGSGNAIATMKHSDLVTLDNGSALFVPLKDMTVVTPKGSVKLSANSVAFVSVNSTQLSVYDINDHHKSSVVVSTGGRDLALSPGRHLVVTHAAANSFADVNPIESIMHRSVNSHELGAGKRAFVTEFSIPSAVSVLKPLKALMASNDDAAKKVANRVLKTSAVVMMMGGNKPFEFHAKPRTVALNWK